MLNSINLKNSFDSLSFVLDGVLHMCFRLNWSHIYRMHLIIVCVYLCVYLDISFPLPLLQVGKCSHWICIICNRVYIKVLQRSFLISFRLLSQRETMFRCTRCETTFGSQLELDTHRSKGACSSRVNLQVLLPPPSFRLRINFPFLFICISTFFRRGFLRSSMLVAISH